MSGAGIGRERLLAAAARLVTDAGYRGRMFAEPAPAAIDLGLAPDELALLRRLDPARLGIVSEGYAGKRLEAVESAFPRTLALLESLRPGARRHYLESTPFPPDDAAERATFRAFVAQDAPDGERRRLLADLALVEEAVHRLPPPAPPAYRLYGRLRPRPSPSTWSGVVSGPLPDALRGGGYPERPTRLLALRPAGGLRMEPLDEAAAKVWTDCTGDATLDELRQRHGDSAPTRVGAWLRSGALEDAG